MINTEKLDTRFRNLFKNGQLVQVNVRKWSMCVSVSPQDLGINTDPEKQEVIPEFISLGRKNLFTNDVRLKFSRIESCARNYLNLNSHKFPVADAHFVPQKALIKVRTTLDQYREEYDKATQDFIANYEKHKQKMFDTFPDHTAKLQPFYPSVEQIRSKFSFNVTSYEVAFPQHLKSTSMTDIVAQNMAAEAHSKKYEAQMKLQYDQQMRQMEEFVQSSALAMRNKIVETFEVIAEKIKGKEVVTATNLKTLKNVIDSFDALDFLDDTKVREGLASVKKLVESGADFKDNATALARLETALNTTLDTAKNMSDVDEITGGYIRRLDLTL